MAERGGTIKHIMLAISSLFESNKVNSLAEKNFYAIREYNIAITELLKCQDAHTAFIASRMFVVTDFAIGNLVGAFRHDDHGLAILHTLKDKYPMYPEKFSLSFKLMRVLRSFFTQYYDHVHGQSIPTWRTWWLQAIGALHGILQSTSVEKKIICQAVEFVQVMEAHNTQDCDTFLHLSQMHTRLLDELDQYLSSREIELNHTAADLEEDSIRRERHMKDLIVKICLGTCLSRDPSVLFKFKQDFEAIVALAPVNSAHVYQVKRSLPPLDSNSQLLESPYLSAILSFVVLHCRQVEVQMQAMARIYSIPDLDRRIYCPPSSMEELTVTGLTQPSQVITLVDCEGRLGSSYTEVLPDSVHGVQYSHILRASEACQLAVLYGGTGYKESRQSQNRVEP
jgi:hypothetical protein